MGYFYSWTIKIAYAINIYQWDNLSYVHVGVLKWVHIYAGKVYLLFLYPGMTSS